MSSRTKEIGTIGEQVIITEFLKRSIPVLLPVGDNLPFDMVIILKNKFLKVQVKTAEKVRKDKMIFYTNISNPYIKTNRKYTKEEIDLFAFYCMENNYIGLMPVEFCTSNETNIRLTEPKNNQTKKVKMANDYSFDKVLHSL